MTETRFDSAPTARPLFKERLLWLLLAGGFFLLSYGASNQISALTGPHRSLAMPWESAVPFVPWLVVPYLSSDLLFVVAFAVPRQRQELQRFALRCGLAVAISCAFFLLWPLEVGFERPEMSGWPVWFFDALSFDLPYNQFPSLHISLGFLCWQAIDTRCRGLAKIVNAAWFTLIAASTLLVYQHQAIDLLGGGAVAWLVCRVIPDHKPLNFVSPRHLHMAFRYLLVAGGAILAAFALPAIWPVLVWIGVSLLFVAANYALGRNEFLHKRGGHGPVTWLIYGPYLIGSWVNWLYWRARLPAMNHVADGVWIGGRPSRQAWGSGDSGRFAAVIDLAPELSAVAADAPGYRHLPLQDIAIPAPAALDRAARAIDAGVRQGEVYVHCALGLSRSVLAVCAWLMLRGHSAEEALAVIDRARPERVRRPYMNISLDLLSEYREARS